MKFLSLRIINYCVVHWLYIFINIYRSCFFDIRIPEPFPNNIKLDFSLFSEIGHDILKTVEICTVEGGESDRLQASHNRANPDPHYCCFSSSNIFKQNDENI